jgi:hypothetical protein
MHMKSQQSQTDTRAGCDGGIHEIKNAFYKAPGLSVLLCIWTLQGCATIQSARNPNLRYNAKTGEPEPIFVYSGARADLNLIASGPTSSLGLATCINRPSSQFCSRHRDLTVEPLPSFRPLQ